MRAARVLSPDYANGWTFSRQLRNLERRCMIDSRGSLAAWATMTIQNAEQESAVTRGAGNVIADLGFPDVRPRCAWPMR